MALSHWGFIYTAAGADPQRDWTVVDSGGCTTVLVGISSAEQGVDVARRLVDEGVQLIELCGGFGPVHTGRIIEAIDGAVPVGSVGYGPESVDQVHAIFA
jgi:predicted polyphosphate/ATP-dependent NAD kinase